jgi:anthranilate synthase/aminodeoxychorismate synthase-like glutamine amidotransferase
VLPGALAAAIAAGVPVFGVCLGLQAIVVHAGGRVGRARRVVHGRTSVVEHDGSGCFTGLPSPLRMTRYHSLAADRSRLPACLEVTAWTRDGEVMGVRRRDLEVEGVQFHPESVRSVGGVALIGGVWARAARATSRVSPTSLPEAPASARTPRPRRA